MTDVAGKAAGYDPCTPTGADACKAADADIVGLVVNASFDVNLRDGL